ncbi:MFS general substrate transporter, partial [Coemansia reversa NRRL 1564]
MQLTDDFASDAIFDHSRAQRCKVKSFREMLINYYSNTEYYRTPQQIRRDEWIIPGRVRCRAWMVIPIAVISQFCLGSLYAWSIFNKPIDKHIFNDHEANFAHITFYIALGMLGLSGAVFGPWIESHSPRMCALLGAVVFFAGHCTAALGLACREIAMLYFGYGFIGGIGLGIGYVTTIDAVIKWYPSSRGFASGLAVSGFGAGSVAFSNLNAVLLRVFTVPQAFAILGTINLVVMLVCALLMRPPHPDYNIPGVAMDMIDQSLTEINYHQHRTIQHTIKGRSANIGGQTITVASDSGDPVLVITLSQALSSPDFWLLWIAFFVNLVFGVVLISNLASMTTHMFGVDTPAPVTAIVTIDGVFNASGRLLSGWVSDSFGRRRTFLLVISTQIVIVACLISIIPQLTFWPFIVLVWLATLCYGGGVGVIAATLADMFGAPNMSSCHGVMLTGWSVAAIGGGLTYTAIVNYMTGSLDYTVRDPFVYVVNEYWIISLLICGWISLLFIRVTPRERLFPRVHDQIFRCTFVGFTFRLAR